MRKRNRSVCDTTEVNTHVRVSLGHRAQGTHLYFERHARAERDKLIANLRREFAGRRQHQRKNAVGVRSKYL